MPQSTRRAANQRRWHRRWSCPRAGLDVEDAGEVPNASSVFSMAAFELVVGQWVNRAFITLEIYHTYIASRRQPNAGNALSLLCDCVA
jgi:hypothetical protein